MDFLTLSKTRQSDRAYDHTKSIEPEKLDRIMEAARLAPSACNAQPWKFIIVDDPDIKNRLADCTSSKVLGMNHFTKQAPVHIVIIEEKRNFNSTIGSWVKRKHFPLIDIGIAASHISLAAASEGLGSCIIGWFDENKVQKLLNIPSSKRVLLIITLGYSTQECRKKIRKDSTEVISRNTY